MFRGMEDSREADRKDTVLRAGGSGLHREAVGVTDGSCVGVGGEEKRK